MTSGRAAGGAVIVAWSTLLLFWEGDSHSEIVAHPPAKTQGHMKLLSGRAEASHDVDPLN